MLTNSSLVKTDPPEEDRIQASYNSESDSQSSGSSVDESGGQSIEVSGTPGLHYAQNNFFNPAVMESMYDYRANET